MAVRHLALALATAPSSPETDQLWYDKSNEVLKRWDGSDWVIEGTGTYQLLVDALWIDAGRMHAAFGSPSLSGNGGFPGGWLLDASSQEVIGLREHGAGLLSTWTTLDVVVWWANAGAGTGDVVFDVFTEIDPAGGTDASGPTSYPSTTATAGSKDVIVATTVAAGVTAPTAAQLFSVRVDRLAGDAADTLANDLRVMGVLLQKAS